MDCRILFYMCLLLTQCTKSTGQQNKDLEKDLPIKATTFINTLSTILNQGEVLKIKSDIIVSKEELRTFLEEEWTRKYNASWRNKMKDKFEPSVEKGWAEIQRNDGYYLVGSFVKDVVIDAGEKTINPNWKNARFQDIRVSSSEQYDSSVGEISMLKLFYIHTKATTDTNPMYTYQCTFPCILTNEGYFKMIGSIQAGLVSTEQKK